MRPLPLLPPPPCHPLPPIPNLSKNMQMHAAKGQAGGGRYTFCTYCLGRLRVSEQTLLADRNTHVNATITPTANRFAAVPSRSPNSTRARVEDGGISTPSSKSLSSSSQSPSRTVSYLGHHKSDESRWRDCSTLFGSTRRNRLPSGQSSATTATRGAEGELLLSSRGGLHRLRFTPA